MIIPHKQLDKSWTVLSEVQSTGAWWANQEKKILYIAFFTKHQINILQFLTNNHQIQLNTIMAKYKGWTT